MFTTTRSFGSGIKLCLLFVSLQNAACVRDFSTSSKNMVKCGKCESVMRKENVLQLWSSRGESSFLFSFSVFFFFF